MYLSNAPGVWIPLSDEESAQLAKLLDEIADLAQTEPGGERHLDRLAKLSLLIGSAAAGAAVAETEGPEAEKKWRGKQRWQYGIAEQLWMMLKQVFGDGWRHMRRHEQQKREADKVVDLKARRERKREMPRRTPW